MKVLSSARLACAPILVCFCRGSYCHRAAPKGPRVGSNGSGNGWKRFWGGFNNSPRDQNCCAFFPELKDGICSLKGLRMGPSPCTCLTLDVSRTFPSSRFFGRPQAADSFHHQHDSCIQHPESRVIQTSALQRSTPISSRAVGIYKQTGLTLLVPDTPFMS